MEQQNHRPTARVLEILEALASADGGLTLTEIASATGAAKSTVFPIIHTLEEREYIKFDKRSGAYVIGLASYALSSTYLENNPLQRLVLDEMRRVVDKCSEICQLGVLDGGDVLYIGKVDSPESIRLMSHVGKRIPAPCTALGKALLCNHSREELLALYPDGLPAMTAKSIRDFDRFLKMLALVKENHPATDDEESTEHVMCVAIPLRKSGVINAAISVSVPTFRNTPEKRALVISLLLAAQQRIESIMEERNESLRNGKRPIL